MSTLETARANELSPGDGGRLRMPVTVRLFGILKLLMRERLVELNLPEGATVGDVLRELGKRFGGDCLARIWRAPAQRGSGCALFVNGEPVDDIDTEVAASGATAEVAVTLFMAAEGLVCWVWQRRCLASP